MTIELYLLRHAHAGDPLKWQGSDYDRPLSAKGRDQTDRLGAHLKGLGFDTDAIVTSPKVRARETADLFAAHFGVRPVVDDRLADILSRATIDAILTDAGDPSSVVLIGHDPDFSEALGLLTGALDIEMRKGAMARIDIARPLAAGTGVLRWLLPPELLRRPK